MKLKKGLLIVLSGPSGVGKGTLRTMLMKDKKLNIKYSISMTTRPKREGEVNKKDYFFVTKEEFKQAIKNGEMLEYAQYVNNYYGTPRKYTESLRNKGLNVLLEIETKGALQVMKWAKNNKDTRFLSIFISPPSLKKLIERLKGRGTESTTLINQRIQTAKNELKKVKYYQFNIVNNNLSKAHKELKQIVWNAINE